eukprot:5721310-Pyramimonas_sp.AAC.1
MSIASAVATICVASMFRGQVRRRSQRALPSCLPGGIVGPAAPRRCTNGHQLARREVLVGAFACLVLPCSSPWSSIVQNAAAPAVPLASISR